jgi:hypothetical protein
MPEKEARTANTGHRYRAKRSSAKLILSRGIQTNKNN